MNKEQKIIGHLLFFGGLILSFICGIISFFTQNVKITSILYILIFLFGIITGYHNIKRKELNSYLLSLLVLIFVFNNFYILITYLIQGFGSINSLYNYVEPFSKLIYSFVIFISSAALIPSLKVIIKTLEE